MTNDMPELGCNVCNDPQGWIEKIEDGLILPYACVCRKRRHAAEFLGAEIWSAAHLKSDLYMGRDQDSTTKNLFLKGTYDLGLAHLRWALSAKRSDTPNFRFRRVNDNMLLKCWGGDLGYTRRQKEARESIEVFNTLDDLCGDVDLLVVQLGIQDYMTRGGACASALLEALNIRQFRAKPTWIFRGDVDFVDGHPAWKAETQALIAKSFETIDLGGESAREPEIRDSGRTFQVPAKKDRPQHNSRRRQKSGKLSDVSLDDDGGANED